MGVDENKMDRWSIVYWQNGNLKGATEKEKLSSHMY